jgi:hypothetical protein
MEVNKIAVTASEPMIGGLKSTTAGPSWRSALATQAISSVQPQFGPDFKTKGHVFTMSWKAAKDDELEKLDEVYAPRLSQKRPIEETETVKETLPPLSTIGVGTQARVHEVTQSSHNDYDDGSFWTSIQRQFQNLHDRTINLTRGLRPQKVQIMAMQNKIPHYAHENFHCPSKIPHLS